MRRKPKTTAIRVTIRIPVEMLRKIDSIAVRERRPQNTQLLIFLERGLAA